MQHLFRVVCFQMAFTTVVFANGITPLQELIVEEQQLEKPHLTTDIVNMILSDTSILDVIRDSVDIYKDLEEKEELIIELGKEFDEKKEALRKMDEGLTGNEKQIAVAQDEFKNAIAVLVEFYDIYHLDDNVKNELAAGYEKQIEEWRQKEKDYRALDDNVRAMQAQLERNKYEQFLLMVRAELEPRIDKKSKTKAKKSTQEEQAEERLHEIRDEFLGLDAKTVDLDYDYDTRKLKNPALFDRLEQLEKAIFKYVSSRSKRKENAPDQKLTEWKRELEIVRTALIRRLMLDKLTGQNPETLEVRAGITDQILALQSKLDTHRKALPNDQKVAERNWNMRAYQSLSRAMTLVTTRIKAGVDQGKKPAALRDLRVAFITLMHALEVFEQKLYVKYKGADPYPQFGLESVVDRVINLLDRAEAGDLDSEMPTKAYLMRQYHLAQNGIDGLVQAHFQALTSIKETVWKANAKDLVEWVKRESIGKQIGAIEEFSMRNPVIAKELLSNLTHTYKILNMDRDTPWNELLGNVRTVYEIKEVENMVSDWLLGSQEHLYSSANVDAPPLSVETIAFIDLAARAPDFAGAYIGARGKSIPSDWTQSFVEWTGISSIPFIGKPILWASGSAAGIAEVRLQKYAASRMSREHEVLANSLRRGFEAAHAGKSVFEIGKAVATYRVAREAIRIIGEQKRNLSEGSFWDELKIKTERCVKDNYGSSGALATVGGLSSVIAGGFLFAASTPVVVIFGAPVLVTAGCGAIGLMVADAAKDALIEGRKEERSRQKAERRLKNIASMLPVSSQTRDWNEETTKAIDEAVKRITPEDYEEMSKNALGDDKKVSEQKVHTLFLAKLDSELEKLDKERLLKIHPQEVDDPTLDPLKEKIRKLVAHDAKAHREIAATANEAVEILKKMPRLDQFEQDILKDLIALSNSVGNKNLDYTVSAIKAIEEQVQMLRVRQMDDQLFKQTQPDESVLKI